MANITWWRVLMINMAGLIGVFGVGFDDPRSGVITISLKEWREEYDDRHKKPAKKKGRLPR